MSRATANGGDRLSRLHKLQMEIDNRNMEDRTPAIGTTKVPPENKMDSTAVNRSSKEREKMLNTDHTYERPNRFTSTSRYVPLSERAGSGISSGYGSQDSLEKRSVLSSSSNSSVGSSSGSSREVILGFSTCECYAASIYSTFYK